MTDSEKLRSLATWLDHLDIVRDNGGNDEVQKDLRRIADEIEQQPIPQDIKTEESQDERKFTLQEMIHAIFEGETIGEFKHAKDRNRLRWQYFKLKFGIDISRKQQ